MNWKLPDERLRWFTIYRRYSAGNRSGLTGRRHGTWTLDLGDGGWCRAGTEPGPRRRRFDAEPAPNLDLRDGGWCRAIGRPDPGARPGVDHDHVSQNGVFRLDRAGFLTPDHETPGGPGPIAASPPVSADGRPTRRQTAGPGRPARGGTPGRVGAREHGLLEVGRLLGRETSNDCVRRPAATLQAVDRRPPTRGAHRLPTEGPPLPAGGSPAPSSFPRVGEPRVIRRQRPAYDPGADQHTRRHQRPAEREPCHSERENRVGGVEDREDHNPDDVLPDPHPRRPGVRPQAGPGLGATGRAGGEPYPRPRRAAATGRRCLPSRRAHSPHLSRAERGRSRRRYRSAGRWPLPPRRRTGRAGPPEAGYPEPAGIPREPGSAPKPRPLPSATDRPDTSQPTTNATGGRVASVEARHPPRSRVKDSGRVASSRSVSRTCTG